jgi:hypothetical protein
MQDFNWRPGIGDPTIGGWVTVVLYFLAVWATWKAANRSFLEKEKTLWRMISIMFIGLGVNKQLDLQSALTEIARIIAFDEGWYDQRRVVQIWFIVGVATFCLLIALILSWFAYDTSLPARLALFGTVLVLAFVLIRAASFHHIDQLIGDRILGLKWNWVLEMGGIAIVLFASEWRRRDE